MNEKPNILLITTDQQRADCLGAAGHPVVETPHLDQLAAEGVRFESAYSDCPICIPARCSIISGQHAFTYGKPYFFAHQPFPVDRSKTMMSLLTAGGYQTQAVGKMHFYPERSTYGFENMMLDHDYTEWLNERTENRHLSFVGQGMGLNEFQPVLSPVPAHLTSTVWTAEESIRFLKKRDPQRPFFLWTSFFDPHPPIDPPEPYYSMYDDYPIPDPVIGDWTDDAPFDQRHHRESYKYDMIPPRTVRKIRSCYYGMISQIDHQLGRLFGVMRQLGLWDNTVVLFTSDHGEMLGDHRDFGKTNLYEASSKVPFLLRLPKGWNKEQRGTVRSEPVGLVDILPTLLEASGAEPPDGIDGRSLLPLVQGDAPGWRSHYPGEVRSSHGSMLSLTDGKEKYIFFQWGSREQFFHLEEDPLERRDLSKDPAYAHRVKAWREKLIAELAGRSHPATDGAALLGNDAPYPSEREVRASNPLGWMYDRPNS